MSFNFSNPTEFTDNLEKPTREEMKIIASKLGELTGPGGSLPTTIGKIQESLTKNIMRTSREVFDSGDENFTAEKYNKLIFYFNRDVFSSTINPSTFSTPTMIDWSSAIVTNNSHISSFYEIYQKQTTTSLTNLLAEISRREKNLQEKKKKKPNYKDDVLESYKDVYSKMCISLLVVENPKQYEDLCSNATLTSVKVHHYTDEEINSLERIVRDNIDKSSDLINKIINNQLSKDEIQLIRKNKQKFSGTNAKKLLDNINRNHSLKISFKDFIYEDGETRACAYETYLKREALTNISQ